MDSKTANEDERCGRRVAADRRARTEPIPHQDRRKGERRSGGDRRLEPRH